MSLKGLEVVDLSLVAHQPFRYSIYLEGVGVLLCVGQ